MIRIVNKERQYHVHLSRITPVFFFSLYLIHRLIQKAENVINVKKVRSDCTLIMWEVAQRVFASVGAPNAAKQVSRGVTCVCYQTECCWCITTSVTILYRILVP